MQELLGRRHKNILSFATQWIILCLAVHTTTVFGLSFNVTLSSLTNHNTSAYSAYNENNFAANFGTNTWISQQTNLPTSHMFVDPTKMDESLNPVTPGHVSKTDVHSLIPSRTDLRWFAHATPWFGTSSHIKIGLTNNTTAYVAAMITDMKNRGFNGVVIDWYGIGDGSDGVTQKIKSYLAGIPGNTFKYIVMVDKGVAGGLGTNNLQTAIHYCQTNYFPDTNYEREPVSTGEPILMFFGVRSAVGETAMADMKSFLGGNMVWVEQGTSYIGESWEDESFQWTDCFTDGINTNDPFNLGAVTSEFGTLKSNGKKFFGAMCSQFNGTLTKSIGWSLGKYLPGSNGLCLVERAASINSAIPSNMTRMQWPTWSDWEEGTEVEAGIENSVALTAQVNAAGILTWTINAGEPRAIDHFEIYASSDGVNAALLASVPSSASQADISQAGLASGTYSIYVDAVAIPCVRDHLSPPVSYTAQSFVPTDYSRSMKITFAGYNRGTTLSNFPALVELSTSLSGFAYNQFMSPVGNDLRFTDAAGNLLCHEIDQWNTNGVSTVWVNVPTIASSTNYIMAYWGDRADTNTPVFSTNGSTWLGFSAALHLKETGFPYADGTTLHPATTGNAPTMTTSGEIGDAETFDGATDYLVPLGAINLGNSFSLSAWVKLASAATNIQTIWANKTTGFNGNGVALFVNSFDSADGRLLLETGDGVNGLTAQTTPNAVPVGAWHHVFVSANRTGGTAALYVDGVNVTDTNHQTITSDLGNDSVFNVGRYTNGLYYFNGTMDEARIEPIRSADWVWATWINVASNSFLENYGPITLTKVLDQDAFTSSIKLTIAGYTGTTTLTNFPLLVNLSTGISGFSYSQFASPKGYDLRFTDASGQILCNYQIDTWTTNGTSSVWVQVPSLFSSTNYLIAYWGNPALTNAASFTTNGSTWTNYSAVFHLLETGFPYADSTTLHPATNGVAPVETASGEIGNAEIFNGTSEYLAPSGAINLGNSFSLSAWVKLDSAATNIQAIWANKPGGATQNGVALFVNTYQTADGKLSLETGNGTGGSLAQTTAGAVPVGGWHHVFASVDRAGGTVALYVDGVNKTAANAVTTNLANDNAFNMARFTDGTWPLKGTLDEARIEPMRSADWILAAWKNVASNSSFVNYPSVGAPAVVIGRQIQPPRLLMSATASGLLLNWSDPTGKFTLYSATSLQLPVQWTPVTNYTVLPGGQVQVPFTSTPGGSVFYRLQSQ